MNLATSSVDDEKTRRRDVLQKDHRTEREKERARAQPAATVNNSDVLREETRSSQCETAERRKKRL